MVTIKLVIEILRQNICLILPVKACNHMHVVVMTIIDILIWIHVLGI